METSSWRSRHLLVSGTNSLPPSSGGAHREQRSCSPRLTQAAVSTAWPIAIFLGISERHASRLLAVYRARGAAALGHSNRGHHPHNAVPADVASVAVRLATTRYPGANDTHLAELLWEHRSLDESNCTVRRILARAASTRAKRSPPSDHPGLTAARFKVGGRPDARAASSEADPSCAVPQRPLVRVSVRVERACCRA